MKKSPPRQFITRVLFYITGLFFMAFGVALSVNSGLGVSPVNSLPYVIHQISGTALSTCIIVVFCSYILLQALILRRDFQSVSLFQILFSTVFGYFVDLSKWLIGSFSFLSYLGKLAMLAVSIVLVAIGVVLYIEVKLIPMPMEGLSLTLSQKLNISFHNTKIMIDCAVVLIGILLSYLFLHHLTGIREGTIITALATGKVMALVKAPLSSLIQRYCFGDD